MAILLDSTVLIDALCGREAAERIRALHRVDDTPYVCAINVEEVVRGLRAGEGVPALRLLGAMRLAPLGLEEGVRAGTWRQRYGRRGRTLTQADCLIAAAAVSVGGRLATGNPKHFPMPELEVEHWPVGT